jgi:hypothetical protein
MSCAFCVRQFRVALITFTFLYFACLYFAVRMYTHPSERVRFGAFELDLSTGELRSIEGPHPNNKVLLREQMFQVMRMLVERDGTIALVPSAISDFLQFSRVVVPCFDISGSHWYSFFKPSQIWAEIPNSSGNGSDCCFGKDRRSRRLSP